MSVTELQFREEFKPLYHTPEAGWIGGAVYEDHGVQEDFVNEIADDDPRRVWTICEVSIFVDDKGEVYPGNSISFDAKGSWADGWTAISGLYGKYKPKGFIGYLVTETPAPEGIVNVPLLCLNVGKRPSLTKHHNQR